MHKKSSRTISLLLAVLFVLQSTGAAYAQYTQDDFNCQYLNTCNYDQASTACGETGAQVVVEESSDYSKNLVTAYNYFLSQKTPEGNPMLQDFQAAGIIGNISVESGGNQQISQNPHKTIADPMQVPTTDQAKSAAESNGAVGVGHAWGLIQWDHGARSLYYQKQSGVSGEISSLQTQLDLVWWHMNNDSPVGKKNMVEGLTQTKNVEEATLYYEKNMEGSSGTSNGARIAAANVALKYPKTDPVFTSASTGCQCSAPVVAGSQGTVVLDPGHSGIDKQGKEKDPETGLYIGDSSNNPPELKQAWDTAQKAKTILEKNGYRVVLTKQKMDDYVNLKQRAVVANDANAAIAVSIHTDGSDGSQFGTSAKSWVTAQKVGGYRVNDAGKKTVFDNEPVAQKSQEYARIIVAARKAAGEKGATEHDLNFTGRKGLSGGNLSIVQLFSKVPWIYNEASQNGFDADVYAEGIANGIMKAVKPAKDPPVMARAQNRSILARLESFFSPTAFAEDEVVQTNDGCAGAASGDAVQTAINYAWPTYKKPFKTHKKTYEKAVLDAMKSHKFVGGCNQGDGIPSTPQLTCNNGAKGPGIDCGGFVTRAMQDSGTDPKYGQGGPTDTQWNYLKTSDLYRGVHEIVGHNNLTTADLKPGDILIGPGHTYMYVGPGHMGTNDDGSEAKFESSIASASMQTRAPMAGREDPVGDTKRGYQAFRYIGSGGDSGVNPI